MMDAKNARLEFLSDKNSCVVRIDYQPTMIRGVASSDKVIIKAVAVGAAKAASILGIPVVLSTINPQNNGTFFPEIAGLFPGQQPLARKVPGFDAFEDEAVLSAVKQTGRSRIVISGLWTSMCFAFTALHGLKEGWLIYGLMDAAGDSTPDAHKYGIERMLQAGVIPLTLEALVSEWMHAWSNPKSAELVREVYTKYGDIIGLR